MFLNTLLPNFDSPIEIIYETLIETRLNCCLQKEDVEILEITFPRYSVRDYFAVVRPEHSEKINSAFSEMFSGKWTEAHLCQKPLTMGVTYSEYRARFSSKNDFLRHYRALPEEIVRGMIKNSGASESIMAYMYSVWKGKNEDDLH